MNVNRTVSDLLDDATIYDCLTYAPYTAKPDGWAVRASSDVVALSHSLRVAASFVQGSAASPAVRSLVSDKRRTAGREERKTPAINKGGAKYQGAETPQLEALGGFDGGVEIGILGAWEPQFFDELKIRLDAAKTAADEGNFDSQFMRFGSHIWKVWPKGAALGNGGPKYKYVMESHGLKLYIHNNPRGDIQPLRLRFGAVALQKCDLYEIWGALVDELRAEGFEVSSTCVSRADLQIMLPIPITDFTEILDDSCIVTRCRGKISVVSDMRTKRVESVTLRSENQELCVYDKIAEINTKSPEEYHCFALYYFGGVDNLPKELTRFEFRFRREALKRYGITTLEDLRSSQQALIDIAASDWFRILDRPKVRGSEIEQRVNPLWQIVQNAFHDVFDPNKKHVPAVPVTTRWELMQRRPTKHRGDWCALLKQAAGCISSAFAVRRGLVIGNIRDFWAALIGMCPVPADKLLLRLAEKQQKSFVQYGF